MKKRYVVDGVTVEAATPKAAVRKLHPPPYSTHWEDGASEYALTKVIAIDDEGGRHTVSLVDHG